MPDQVRHDGILDRKRAPAAMPEPFSCRVGDGLLDRPACRRQPIGCSRWQDRDDHA